MIFTRFIVVVAVFAAVPRLAAEDCQCDPLLGQPPRARVYQTSGTADWKPCQFATNVVDRWDGDHPLIQIDTRPTEFWYHTPTAAKHRMKFSDVPAGHKVRIVGFDLNVVCRFTGRDAQRFGFSGFVDWVFGAGKAWAHRYPSGWGFIALHTGDTSRPTTIVEPHVGRDVILWEQMPIAEQQVRLLRPWRDDVIINGVLADDILELRQGMFDFSGHETQIETTGEFYFCYEPAAAVNE